MTSLPHPSVFASLAMLFSLVGCGGAPDVGGARPSQQEAQRRSHLLALGDRYLAFQAAHGRSPATAQEFVAHVRQGNVDETLEAALEKLESGDIEMVWNGKQILNGGRPFLWGYEKQAEVESGFVLLSTFAVTETTREEFAELERLPSAP